MFQYVRKNGSLVLIVAKSLKLGVTKSLGRTVYQKHSLSQTLIS